MLCASLNSGSNGNCIYVECGGARLLLDAGISAKQTAERLAQLGRCVNDIDGVIISHDHADHVRGAGVLARKFALPVYMTQHTHQAARRCDIGSIPDLRLFTAGSRLTFGALTVETHPTPHDGADPVAFVVTDGRRRLGVLTDLGYVFPQLPDVLAGLDATFLESNYDPDMLANGPYPFFLKQRILGQGGHISNVECAELVGAVAPGRLQWVALAHLSETNNTPDLAHRTHARIVGTRRPIHVAPRYTHGELLRVE